MRRSLPKASDKPKFDSQFERTPQGYINNCALATYGDEKDCQMCKNRCPDRSTLFKDLPLEDRDMPVADAEEPQGTTLTEALDEVPSDRSKGRHKSKRSTYTSPQGSLSLGKLDRIVERTFDFDLDEAAKEVDEFLAPGDDRRLDFGLLQTELDGSTEMAILAHRLYTNAREACEIFEIDRDIIISAMRDSARYTLEQDLRNKIRLKPITDADVLSMMKMQDPGKWRDLKVKAVRMEATRDHLERISDLARKRIDVLNTLVEKKR